MDKRRINRWFLRYGAAVAAPILALLLRLVIVHWVGDLPTYITFYPAVMFVAMLAGVPPGLLATVVATLLTDYWIIHPRGHIGLESTAELVGQVLFLFMGTLMSTVAGLYRRARERAAIYERQLAVRQSEAELRQQKNRLAAIVESSDNAILSKDLEGAIQTWNTAAERMFGYTADEVIGKPLMLLNPPELMHEEEQILQRLRAGERTENFESVRVAKNGRRIDVQVNISPVRDADGHLIAVSTIIRDITERKRTEQALQESEWRYRSFVEASAQVVWTTNAQGEVVLDIPAWQAYTGQTAEEAHGLGWMNAIRAEDRERVAAAWKKASESRGLYEVEYQIRKHDGSWRSILARGVPVLNADGSVREYIGTCIDITERKLAEQALRDSQADLNRAQAVAQVGSWRLNVQRNELLWSDENHRIFGRPSGTALTYETFLSIVHPDDRAYVDERWKGALRGEPYDIEHRIIVNGAVKWVREKAELEFDARGQVSGGFGTTQDITQAKAVAEELAAAKVSAEQAKAAAEEANQAKDHFLAVLSHELRTPLTPVLATVSLLQAQADLAPDVHQQLEVVRRNVELEARLIDDLLDITRIARGKVELDRRPVQLGEVIHRAIEVCRPDIEARHLDFGLAMEPKTPCIIDADPGRLQQVFWNLIKNAVKFTPHGGCVGVRCYLEDSDQLTGSRVQGSATTANSSSLNPEPVSGGRIGSPNQAEGRLDPSFVVVEVIDNGEGIAPEALPRIFNAFEQAERSITRQFGGLGLGLTISRTLVELHGGTIQAESRGQGQGATFRVRLPLLRPTPPSKAPARNQPSPVALDQPSSASDGLAAVSQEAPARPLRVLLVEDHGDTSRIMTRLLTLRGYEVHTAGDVTTGLAVAGAQIAADKPFDLIISDLGLPDRSGLELIRELRSQGHTMPAIAISGYGQDEDIQRSRQAGFNAHLTKPVDFEQFYRAIAAVVS